MEKKIEKIILKYIGYNYGSQEMISPSYNIKELSKYIVKELNENESKSK